MILNGTNILNKFVMSNLIETFCWNDFKHIQEHGRTPNPIETCSFFFRTAELCC
jgi:hypothetical protein